MTKRRTAVLGLLALLLVSLALAPSAQAATADEPTVVVATANDSYPPFSIPIAGGEKSIGFDRDLVTAVAKVAGFRFEFPTFAFPYLVTPPGPWADCDMVAAALTPAPWRRSFMQFSDLYFIEDPYGPAAFAFPKTREGTALCARVNAALRQVKDSGTWTKIYFKWFGVAPTAVP